MLDIPNLQKYSRKRSTTRLLVSGKLRVSFTSLRYSSEEFECLSEVIKDGQGRRNLRKDCWSDFRECSENVKLASGELRLGPKFLYK